jgi:hemolysin-activating ACP:hemolysin acyltransferase
VYWEIEKIVDDRIKNGQLQYKVKYRNYPNKYNEWKVIDELDADKLIEEYNNRLMNQVECRKRRVS